VAELLERDAELAVAARACDAALAGHGAVMLVRAPAGVGKSQLVSAIRALAAEKGLSVFGAAGGELEQDFPHGVTRQLLEPALPAAPDPRRAELLSGAAALAAPLFGEQAAAAPDAAAIVHGLYWLVANLAERERLLLVVDDAHWADIPSLEAVLYLGRRLEELPVLLVVAARPAEGVGAEMVARIADLPATVAIDLSELSERAAGVLVEAALGAPEESFVRACHEATGGNPYFLRELLAALRADGTSPDAASLDQVRSVGPRTVARSVQLRLGALDPGAVALAGAVAVLGDSAPMRRAAAVAELDPASASRCADALAAAGLLRPERPLGFIHPIVRTAILEGLRPSERSDAQRRAAHALGEEGAAPLDVGTPLLDCEPAGDPWVVARLCAAADAAIASAAPEAAIRLLERALEEPPAGAERARVLLDLARAEARIPRASAIDHYLAAVEALHDPVEWAGAAREVAVLLGLAGRAPEGVAVARAALEALGDASPETARRLQFALMEAARLDASMAGEATRVAADIDRGQGEGELDWVLDAGRVFELVAVGRERPEAARIARRALEEGAASRFRRDYDESFGAAIVAMIAAGENDTAERAITVMLEDHRVHGDLHGFAIASLYASQLALRRGDMAAAEADAEQALRVLGGWEVVYPMVVACLADALTERGRLDESAARLDALDVPAEPPYTTPQLYPLAARARLRAARRDWAGARDDFLALGANRVKNGRGNPAIEPWRSSAALALLALGDQAQAAALVTEELELARVFDAPHALGIALRTAGLVEGGEAGLALLEQAVAVLAPSQARLEHARALTEYGAALRRAGRRGEPARAPLREALDHAVRCGADALAERIGAELRSAGAKPRRTALTGVASLTPSERRVAELAAQSLTNREIAQALFITVKTVEDHLRHTYGKLGVGGKGDLHLAMAAG
jgi:DNA-binding CsgD family transcriptional regulator